MDTDAEKLSELRGAVKMAMAALQAYGNTEEGVNAAYSGLAVAMKQTATEPLALSLADRLDRVERECAAIRRGQFVSSGEE